MIHAYTFLCESTRYSNIAILAIKIRMRDSQKTSWDDMEGIGIQISTSGSFLFLKLWKKGEY